MEKPYDAAVLVIAISKDGKMAVVKDPSFRVPFWKIPGGHKEDGESPAECASRELREETGINIPWKNLTGLSSKELEGYSKYIYIGIIPSWKKLLKTGSDGEKVRLLPARGVLTRKDFLEEHKGIVSFALRYLKERGVYIA